jgi:geranylgeranyl diphosphate synthase type I
MDNKKENLKDSTKKIYQEIVKAVEKAIMKILLYSVDKKYHNLIRYQIACGGKRLRPVLAILAARMMGGRDKDILYPAAALEILHNYTIIIDDIIDSGKLRRGKPTAIKQFGPRITECVAIDYVASVFDMPKEQSSKEKIYQTLIKTLKAMVNGQIYDILFEQGCMESEEYVIKNRYSQISLKDYFEMVKKKTASLFESCAEIGGICANAPLERMKILKDFGRNLGIAFQIQDDILDIFGEERKFGKKIGKDILERKLGNIVILLAMGEFNLKNKAKFLNILRKRKIGINDLTGAINLIDKTGAFKKAQKLEIGYIKKAKKNLSALPQNKWNKILEELVDYLADRKT